MNIREISDIFKDTADNITAIKSYNFGWASDRVRQGNTEDFQELNEFPRVFFAVPTITGSDQTRKQDTYQVTLFFDDLLGYDNEGDEDPTLQIDKWANLQQYANYFVQRLNKIKQSILPNYLFIPEAPSITFDSFTGIQRMITVQLSFNLVVPTNCDPGVITLVQCIANIVTSSNLTASLTTVLKFAASLEGGATVTADINFVQKVQASLLTSANVTGDITIPKLLNASLLATGTTTADLTVNAPSASLLLDLYPNAAAAYSLRKLRTAYTGSAIRVRRSSDNTEQDIGFIGNDLDTTALTTFVGAGNGFVTTWYDQSGNARNATQTTQANQPQIVSSGVVILVNSKAALKFDGSSQTVRTNSSVISTDFSVFGVAQKPQNNENGVLFTQYDTFDDSRTIFYSEGIGTRLIGLQIGAGLDSKLGTPSYLQKLYYYNRNGATIDYADNNSLVNTYQNNRVCQNAALSFSGFTGNFFKINIQELVIYSNSNSSNRGNISNNINTHYAIY